MNLCHDEKQWKFFFILKLLWTVNARMAKLTCQKYLNLKQVLKPDRGKPKK